MRQVERARSGGRGIGCECCLRGTRPNSIREEHTTDTELAAMATEAIHGCRVKPKGANIPEAKGIPKSISLEKRTIAEAIGCSLLASAAPMIAITLWAFSKAVAPLTRTPLMAPVPVATITAVGVANPKAQGQAIAKTLKAHLKA
uniref:Uncharacterized protein n=1 Tax=Glossina austeni TaxID=7395 RepID=A0A1A9VUG8_GLOAU